MKHGLWVDGHLDDLDSSRIAFDIVDPLGAKIPDTWREDTRYEPRQYRATSMICSRRSGVSVVMVTSASS